MARLCPDSDCGGEVTPVAVDGRFMSFDGVLINLPKRLKLPRCAQCHRDVVNADLEEVIHHVLEEEYAEHAEMIEAAKSRLAEHPGDN
jgi:hypothetical protein